MVCDGILDCPDGEDEHDCTDYHCPGRLMCRGLQICVDSKYICDGVVDCLLYGDDELHCHDEICPNGCNCDNEIVNCEESNLQFSLLPKYTKYLFFHNVDVYPEQLKFVKLEKLIILHFNSNNLKDFRTIAHMFKGFKSVQFLSISNYKSIQLESESFVELDSLSNITFINTTIRAMPKNTFRSIHTVKYLDLSFLSIQQIVNHAFCDLYNLTVLDISHNLITVFQPHSFACLNNIKSIDASYNPISQLNADIFWPLGSTLIHLDHASLCCNLVDQQCSYPQEYEIPQQYRCRNIITSRSQFIRYTIFIIGLTIIILNGLSIIVNHTAKVISKDCISLIALALSDSFIGCFYIISYISDHVYDKAYLKLSNGKFVTKVCRYISIIPWMFALSSITITSFISFQRLLDTKYHYKETFLHMHTRFKQFLFILVSSVVMLTSIYAWTSELQFNNMLCFIPTSAVDTRWKIVGLTLSYTYSMVAYVVLFVSYVMFICYVLMIQKIRYKDAKRQQLFLPVIQRLIILVCSHILGLICETWRFSLALDQTSKQDVPFILLSIVPLLNPFTYTLVAYYKTLRFRRPSGLAENKM